MYSQTKVAASVLVAAMLAVSASAGAAATNQGTPPPDVTTTTTTTVIPGDTPAQQPVTSTTSQTVVSQPAPEQDWSVFGGRVVKSSHMASAEIVGADGGLVDAQATYRYGLLDNLGVGLMFSWDQPFTSNIGQTTSTYYNALSFNPFVTIGLLERPRLDVGLTVAPGLRWSFGGCYQNSTYCQSQTGALTLTIRAAALYAVVPHRLFFGVAADIYSDMTFKNNGVSFTLPVLVGGVVEYHVNDLFALTAEAKGGFWAGNYYSITENQVYYITRFAIGLAFHGVP